MLSYQLEKWADFWPDAQDIFPLHYQELALNQDQFPMDVDHERWQQIDTNGYMHLLTVRADGKIVGYYLGIVMPHMHYKSSGLFALTDAYYLLPEYRFGGAGVKLFTEVERTLKERGVKKAYLSCKVHQDHSELFEKLGWQLSDKAFIKVLN